MGGKPIWPFVRFMYLKNCFRKHSKMLSYPNTMPDHRNLCAQLSTIPPVVQSQVANRQEYSILEHKTPNFFKLKPSAPSAQIKCIRFYKLRATSSIFQLFSTSRQRRINQRKCYKMRATSSILSYNTFQCWWYLLYELQ